MLIISVDMNVWSVYVINHVIRCPCHVTYISQYPLANVSVWVYVY